MALAMITASVSAVAQDTITVVPNPWNGGFIWHTQDGNSGYMNPQWQGHYGGWDTSGNTYQVDPGYGGSYNIRVQDPQLDPNIGLLLP